VARCKLTIPLGAVDSRSKGGRDGTNDDKRAMDLIASALMDGGDPYELLERITEIVEFTGRHPDAPPPKENQ